MWKESGDEFLELKRLLVVAVQEFAETEVEVSMTGEFAKQLNVKAFEEKGRTEV